MNNKKLQIDIFFFNNLHRHVEISKRDGIWKTFKGLQQRWQLELLH